MKSGFENQKIQVAGGGSYIGSHTVIELLETGAQVVILDNQCNGKHEVNNRIEKIAGHHPELVMEDVRDWPLLSLTYNHNRIGSAIHFTGLKAVSESVQKSLEYYNNNFSGSLVRLR